MFLGPLEYYGSKKILGLKKFWGRKNFDLKTVSKKEKKMSKEICFKLRPPKNWVKKCSQNLVNNSWDIAEDKCRQDLCCLDSLLTLVGLVSVCACLEVAEKFVVEGWWDGVVVGWGCGGGLGGPDQV